jgi:coenzyme F420-0:L-glutamate ligase/coenzyme F420-1:gamma-L-glutamate ligase
MTDGEGSAPGVDIPRRAAEGRPAAGATASTRLLVVPLPELPDVHPGDDLGRLAAEAWWRLTVAEPDLAPQVGDVLVVTQKVVSKAEGRLVRLAEVEPRPEAVAFAEAWAKDARHVEVVLRESDAVLRMERGLIISRTRHGFVCANAGVDASNVGAEDVVTLLPEDPDASAAHIRRRIEEELGVAVGIIVSDSFGRPWRWGITDVALGVAGFLPLDDLRGTPDTGGRTMQATVVAVADELASAAELASGKTSRRPLVMIRGARLPAGDGTVRGDVVMPTEADLFP